jgi:hypothetical protein
MTILTWLAGKAVWNYDILVGDEIGQYKAI